MNSLKGGRRKRHSNSRRKRRGGNVVGAELMRGAVPFGLFALSNYLGKGTRRSTRKGMRRKTARRAYKKK